jgi:hypothetical protein
MVETSSTNLIVYSLPFPPSKLAGIPGIEPGPRVSETPVQPLHHTPINYSRCRIILLSESVFLQLFPVGQFMVASTPPYFVWTFILFGFYVLIWVAVQHLS